MAGDLVDVLGWAKPIVSKLLAYIPDPQQKAAAQLELFQAQQAGEFKELDARVALAGQQTDIDKAEAQSESPMERNWRPFIGWACGIALVFDLIARPLLAWASLAWWHCPVPPELDMGTLIPILAGMLGLGTMHTAERINRAKGGSP